ncbi:MerR family transcriptional regulator [Marmoricola sp. RAF53]|uniref:MerR family transcriptional regulator n=1 Tax=Marmoricola sp. RAF53 TaxID=3233059 RepID=UPI003F969807
MDTPRVNRRAVETVLESLRRELVRGQRQLARDPRGAVQGAVRQLLSLGPARVQADRVPDPERRTYRIDELAQVTGVTVRNIRAYQERGLLPAPERRGRVALFDDTHVSRLKIITSMLDRGYSAAHITEMLSAWESGKDLADVLGLEGALVAAHVGEEPVVVDRDEARELAGGEVELAVLLDAGLLEPAGERAGERVRVLRPELVRGFAEMRGYGIGTKDMVRLSSDVQVSVDRITRRLVEEGMRQVGHRFTGDDLTGEGVGDLVEMLTRFRHLALTNVNAALAGSLEQRIEEVLAEFLAERLRAADDAGSA